MPCPRAARKLLTRLAADSVREMAIVSSHCTPQVQWLRQSRRHLRPPAAVPVSRSARRAPGPTRPGSRAAAPARARPGSWPHSHAAVSIVWGQAKRLENGPPSQCPPPRAGESVPRCPRPGPPASPLITRSPAPQAQERASPRARGGRQRAQRAAPARARRSMAKSMSAALVKRPRLKRSELSRQACYRAPGRAARRRGRGTRNYRRHRWTRRGRAARCTRLSPSTPPKDTLRMPGTRGAPSPFR